MSKYKIKVVSSENKKLVTIFTTWERKCGIAKYSQFLYKELENIINEDKIPIKVKIVENINPNSVNPIYWIKMALNLKKSDIIHIQHEFGLFGCFWRGKICGLASYFFYLIIFILKKLKKYKIITTMHEVYEDKKIHSLIRKAYYRLREWPIIFFSDLIIVHTNKARQELISRAMKKKIVTIPHGSYQTPIFLDELECKKKARSGRKVGNNNFWVYSQKKRL
jgi:glycosyltransferase involved in cell wall biosynthesis